jgi:Zn-dependent metalloprotease
MKRFVVGFLTLGLFTVTTASAGISTRFEESHLFYTSGESQSARNTTSDTAGSKMNEATNQFLQSLRTEYNLPAESGFSDPKTTYVGGHVCRRFAQTFETNRVMGGEALICFDRVGEKEETASTICDGTCLAGAQPRVFPPVRIGGIAEDRLRERLGKQLGSVKQDTVATQKVWVDDLAGSGLMEAYSVSFDAEAPYGRFTVYVSALEQKLIAYENHVFSASGQGQVYLRDPKTSALAMVELRDLPVDFALSNRYVAIKNEDVENTKGTDGSFIFPPEDTHFDEVQVYYAMQFALEHYLAWGFKPKDQLPIVVHFSDKYANAYYDGKQIVLGDGDGVDLSDLAKDNTIVTHEYGHKVVDQVSPISGNGDYGEDGALHEGFADYFACATYDMPALGEGVMIDPKYPSLRRCDTDLPFENRNGEVHDAGQVWSGATWEARGAIGADAMDLIVLQSLHRIKATGYMGTVSMNDAYRAILAADKTLFKGQHKKALQAVFTRRGFDEKDKGKKSDTDPNPYHKTPGEPLIRAQTGRL